MKGKYLYQSTVLIFLLLTSCLPISGEKKQQLRPLLEKYFSQQTVYKLVGLPIQEITLPPIPQVPLSKLNGTNTQIYSIKIPSKQIPAREKHSEDKEFIHELYECVYFRKPTMEELRNWLNVLSQSGSREGVYQGLVHDSRYLEKRETQKSLVIPKSLSVFVQYYTQRFLGKQWSIEEIEGKNFYQLKVDLIAQGLEILDQYALEKNEQSRQHIYQWYAVVSMDLSQRFPSLWKNKGNFPRRTQTHALFYYEWAKLWGPYWMKSELIIRLNQLCNFLYNEMDA